MNQAFPSDAADALTANVEKFTGSSHLRHLIKRVEAAWAGVLPPARFPKLPQLRRAPAATTTSEGLIN